MFVDPACGYLACGETGVGRLADPRDILDAVDQGLGPVDSRLRGKRVLVTSGPTREWLDPVRFISNPSSGKMGIALAQEALRRGAQVTLVTGPTSERPPWGAEVVSVETTEEMLRGVEALVAGADVVIGAAAPADYQAGHVADRKIKKTGGALELELTPTPDILAAIAGSKGRRVHVGFAAETQDLEANAKAKLEAKGLDLIVANDVSAPGVGFGGDTNAVTLYGRDGSAVTVAMSSKREVAGVVLDEIENLMK